MALEFYKYQGTGNDFVMIDNRALHFSKTNTEAIAHICNRRFGVGADGLILLENHSSLDFKMVYYNADGNESSMCGNGGRCIVQFAHFLGIIGECTSFEAIDGVHEARLNGVEVSLKMSPVSALVDKGEACFLDTGSPHHVVLVDGVKDYDVYKEGQQIRNEVYGVDGANVNFVSQVAANRFDVRTFERGVEDETLSCGTGVTAVALAMHYKELTLANEIMLETLGGTLKVSFEAHGEGYQNIYLTGPAKQVFKGVL